MWTYAKFNIGSKSLLKKFVQHLNLLIPLIKKNPDSIGIIIWSISKHKDLEISKLVDWKQIELILIESKQILKMNSLISLIWSYKSLQKYRIIIKRLK